MCSLVFTSTAGAEIFMPTQTEINQVGDCAEKSDAETSGIYDPLCGCHLFDGKNAHKLRECLINQYGWKELGPPEYRSGTIRPPSAHPHDQRKSAPHSIGGNKDGTKAKDKQENLSTPLFKH